tara:strand:- start:10121 stop:11044 length:924 start_codon:yes stop_codon:yes gene_type:complete
MRCIVVGLGVQGKKRRQYAKNDFVACVDPFNIDADFREISDVPLESYDAALLCIPDGPKVQMIGWLLDRGKHVLVEKPLFASDNTAIQDLQKRALKSGSVCYTAYNHRFEPHFERMRDLIASGNLGRIYSCRMFYGNGTARLVRESDWRDQGAGVLPDLGSHLLDTINFWFGDVGGGFEIVSENRFENKTPDHVVVANNKSDIRIELEMTLLMWRNHFTCDILAEHGTAHIESLCKWGPSIFTKRKRILPSGRPAEDSVTLVQADPTWELEYQHFRSMVEQGHQTCLEGDLWLNQTLSELTEEVIKS